MKKYMLIICLLLAAVLCFAACAQTEPESTEPSTQATEPSASPSTPTDPTQPPLSAKEQKLIEELTKAHEEDFWLSRALVCTFEDPRDINMKYFVYLGMEEKIRWGSFSEAEQNFLLDHNMGVAANMYHKPVSELTEREKEMARVFAAESVKLPAKELDAVMQRVLGIPLSEVTIGTDMLYYEKEDAYYISHTDAYLHFIRVDYAVETDSGVIHMYYHLTDKNGASVATGGMDTQTGEFHYNPYYCAKLQRLPDGSFRVLSNMIVAADDI